ncbi:unnamed protein product [Clonostachys rosea]|uniref:Glycoside hydrolase family 2 n=1 Tax=Bionectria ochroleuca TaxID=29856 RepID=A0ABY6UXJ0_BIOOC|nr:unnamed protein product [Clonostachys rosea]
MSGINPLTYPLADGPWSNANFLDPPSEYRGAPLWCWNTKLDRDRLLRQIEHLRDMGMGGFHIHSRVGLDTPYMGSEFMDNVKACTQYAKENGLLSCLYDEDRWPSGAAGGLVVADRPEFKAQHLLFTKRATSQGANGRACRSELGYLIARYDIHLENGQSRGYTRLSKNKASGANTWYAYIEPNPPSAWFNGQTYVDTLNVDAIKRFIQTTHEVYYEALSPDFGTTVPSIFTDEPQFAHKSRLRRADDDSDLFLPWSSDLPETFQKEYGHDILDDLPSVLWDIPDDDSKKEVRLRTRYQFHDHVCERFVHAFMDTVAGWCRQRNIALIGHMMKEPTLFSQTQALGEAMRCYRNLDMPGVDMLCDAHEYNTVKQATSVARQNGSRGVMSEIYGVTNWTFDFAGHKGSGDWQAAMGITFRVHHLAWVSMAGEAKRDYPACIGYQSPWYKEYKLVEDHFSRVNVALTRGRSQTRVGVIHPIESYWISYGPQDSTGSETKFMDQSFESLTSWLSFGLIDFDFISESLLPSQTPTESIIPGSPFPVGKSRYDVIIAPNLKTIRTSTLQRLKRFADGGGKVLFAGITPSFIDGFSPLDLDLSPFSTCQWTEYAVLSSLESVRDLRITLKDDGSAASTMLYQMRVDESINERFLFICNTHRKRYFATDVRIQGLWTPTVLDTLTGKTWIVESSVLNGWTSLDWHFEACGSLLLSLKPRKELSAQTQVVFRDTWTASTKVHLKGVKLSEPNVLLLDYAAYKINDEPWREAEEILRIDNIVRERLSLPLKGEAYRQPWAVPAHEREPRATVRLQYEIFSETNVRSSQIALELASGTEVLLDGKAIPAIRSGWWVDEEISVVDIPFEISTGHHLLEIDIPFGLLTNLERVYLLGFFAVEVRGKTCTLKDLDLGKVSFGNWVNQGLPFYAGNVEYICSFTAITAEPTIIHVPQFSAPVLGVSIDGARVGAIAFQPNVVELGSLNPGQEYELRIVCYGNRENAFGTLHMPDGISRWFAPNAWRTEHDWWMEGYNVKPMGIMDVPRIKNPGIEKWVVPRNPDRLWTCSELDTS